jgi:hypothetical protein
MTIRILKRGFIVKNSKTRLATIALILVAMFAGTAPSQAAAAKPGTPVKATAADTLVMGKVGFSDESYCDPSPYSSSSVDRSWYSCTDTNTEPKYLTSWAFAVTNKSKTKSASQVRAQVTFFNKSGSILLQTIVTVAREIKPGKVSYAASSNTYSDAGITGVASATAILINPTWIIPSTKIYQSPIALNIIPGDLYTHICGISQPCATKGGLLTQGAFTQIKADGIFTLKGPAATLPVVIVFLNLQGETIGGWSGLTGYSYRKGGMWDFNTGSNLVSWNQTMSPYELANTATYLFVPQI